MPSNLAALQLFKEYLCDEIGCLDGKIYAISDGLHLYDYQYEIAEARTGYKII
jgi:thymidylate synthase